MPNISTTNIVKIYAEQDGKCYYCGDDLSSIALSGGKIEVDHKIPESAGGVSAKKNYALTCRMCNRAKCTKSEQEFREYIKPYREGLILKQDVSLYNKYLGLHSRFGHLINKESVIKPDVLIGIAEYMGILYRFMDLEASIQEIYDRLEQNGMSKHYDRREDQ